MTEKKLYQINTPLDAVKYGHKLAVNSAGKWVSRQELAKIEGKIE